MEDQDSSSYLLLFIFLVAVFTLVEIVDLYKDIKSKTWPTTVGDIYWEYSGVSIPSGDAYIDPVFQPLRSTKELSFSYNVNGEKYISNNKSFGFTFSDKIEPVNITGNIAKVYYNQSNPKEAVLIPGPKIINIALIALGLCLLAWLIKNYARNL